MSIWLPKNRPWQLNDAAWLREHYENQRVSAAALARELGSTAPTVRRALRRHDIDVRNGSEAQQAVRAHRPLPMIVGRIPLRRTDGTVRAWAVVDVADYEALLEYPWCLDSGYADNARLGRMHRHLLGLTPSDPRQVDHEDRDRLNNRRSNLRLATGAQNAQNQTSRGGTSRHRGVYFCSTTGRWRAVAKLAGRSYHLGRFDSEEDAAYVAAEWRRQNMPYSREDA